MRQLHADDAHDQDPREDGDANDKNEEDCDQDESDEDADDPSPPTTTHGRTTTALATVRRHRELIVEGRMRDLERALHDRMETLERTVVDRLDEVMRRLTCGPRGEVVGDEDDARVQMCDFIRRESHQARADIRMERDAVLREIGRRCETELCAVSEASAEIRQFR